MSRSPRVPAGPNDAKVHCADCLHCKEFKATAPAGTYTLRVRCSKGHWRRGLNGRLEATYSLHTLLARCVPACPDYESTSDDVAERDAFLAGLARELPVEPIVYQPDGRRATHAGRV